MLERKVVEAARTGDQRRIDRAIAAEALKRAEESRERQAALSAELAAAEERRADWRRLAADPGKKGLQGERKSGG